MVELHLYGNVDEDFKKLNLEGIDNILLHGLVSQQQLHKQLAMYDVGLALEPAKDKNNNLAISNKLLSYLQAGLYVVATNTLAQENYLLDFQNHFISINISKKKNNIQILRQLVIEKEEIRRKRKLRFLQFKEKAWEVESKALTTIWNQ
jgi:hypothetical protein